MVDGRIFQPAGVALFINTTVNLNAVETFSTLCACVPIGDWQSASYWVTGYLGFARAALRIMRIPMAGARRIAGGGGARVKDLFAGKSLPKPPRAITIEQANALICASIRSGTSFTGSNRKSSWPCAMRTV